MKVETDRIRQLTLIGDTENSKLLIDELRWNRVVDAYFYDCAQKQAWEGCH